MAYDRRQSDVVVPQTGSGPYRDYRLEVGRAEVPVGVSRTFQLLDPDRAAILRGWVDCLIPARGERPSAAVLGAAEYIDATVILAPALREVLLRAIDRLGAIAGSEVGVDFATAGLEARTGAVRALEAEDRSGAFDMVRDLTYEAYYAHPVVLAVLQRELGWDGVAPTRGSQMEPFDEGLLARVRTLPPRYRVVG
jgi:Gluconate 2-dehydrogenase subunit 3